MQVIQIRRKAQALDGALNVGIDMLRRVGDRPVWPEDL